MTKTRVALIMALLMSTLVGEFCPNKAVTQAEMAAFLYRALG